VRAIQTFGGVAAIVLVMIAAPSMPSFAAPPGMVPVAAKKPAPPPEPPLPAPQMSLKVTPGTGGGPWRVQIENLSEAPVRIPADPRLLILELTPPASSVEVDPKKKKAAGPTAPPKCILPDDTRPSDDVGRELVLPSKRSWSTTIDPLFYCFGARERAALVVGTSVKAKFGWPPPTPKAGAAAKPPSQNPPLAVTPVGASVGKVSGLKAIESDAFSLTEAVTVAKPTTTSDENAATNVTLSVPEAMDVGRGVELSTNIALTNQSDRAITLMYRPDMMNFTVSGPAGNVPCGFPRQIASPIRELFTTVAVKGRTDVAVMFSATCPAGTFDEPGLYRVLPRLDTTQASGRAIGLKSWDGVAIGKAPLLVRVRIPRKPGLPPRPTLD
jgi:hypothetical protein